MRKIIGIAFLSLFLLSAYSQERDNRINITLDLLGFGFEQTDIDNDEKHLILLNVLGISTEYIRLLNNNWIIGGSTQIRGLNPWYNKSTKIGNRTLTVSYNLSGYAFMLSPIIGKAFGDNKNMQVLLYPVMLDFATFDEIEASYDGDTLYKQDIEKSFTAFKSGLRANFQWGSHLVRNGFYVGANIIWYTAGDLSNSFGVEFVQGYKLTFGF